ncbi:MAG: H+/Na+-translocating ferredoxin:NAD+ oxidoreductase subunit [Oceanotoga sp.]|jgi:electron transport complex protein RnfG|uniref:RnfABCDGE type electron transport complex subunit G n=1 Tax=Oceanotoga sp. TaxID=2108366 RepID=UPI00264E9042|nr:RnfABCDGE type electron transport complex subunit G [Oceanotoga sp.]MDN5342915.1 H+/Na+-translocating ferredoxin:NAD+ oxidoreductase subunit [Oceanotoga sp.]
MKEYLKTGLILMLYMIIAAFLVAFVYNTVSPFIDEAEFNAKLKAIKYILKDESNNSLVENIPQNSEELQKYIWKDGEETLYKNSANSKILSPVYKFQSEEKDIYILTVSGIGFGGDVTSVVSFIKTDNDLKLNRIEVINYSQETPGLGAKISEEQIKERFFYIPQSGLENEIKVNKDAGKDSDEKNRNEYKKQGIVQTSDVMTGATITPRGVANSLNIAIEYLQKEGVM